LYQRTVSPDAGRTLNTPSLSGHLTDNCAAFSLAESRLSQ